MTDVTLARACLRAIDNNYSCMIQAERSAIVARGSLPDNLAFSDKHRPSCAGKSLLEMLWDDLITTMNSLMPGGKYAPKGGSEDDLDKYVLQGACVGLARAIATIANPYNPDVNAVRQEAVQRWEAKNAR